MGSTWTIISSHKKICEEERNYFQPFIIFGTFYPSLLQIAICISLLCIVNVTLDWVASQKESAPLVTVVFQEVFPILPVVYQSALHPRHHENKHPSFICTQV